MLCTLTLPAGRMRTRVALAVLLSLGAGRSARAQSATASKSLDQVVALMGDARARGRVALARKTRLVDARPGRPGEVIVTTINSEGKETQSRPAIEGDWVVRNRCPDTGNEQYLVAADKFKRYEPTGGRADSDGWREFRPLGKEMRVLVLNETEGAFSFVAPWGELMVAKPGDALVQDPADEKDVYRVARFSFTCSYEMVP